MKISERIAWGLVLALSTALMWVLGPHPEEQPQQAPQAPAAAPVPVRVPDIQPQVTKRAWVSHKNEKGELMTTTGPYFPGTASSDGAYGTRVWNDPLDTGADDTLYATVSFNDDAQLSQYLKVTDFGFALASDQIVDGIEVTINRMRGIGPALKDDRVRLTSGGTVLSTDKADTATNWPTITLTDKVYGGAADMWGTSLTYSDINDSSFGIVLAVIGDDSALASVDYITISIYHHTDSVSDAFKPIIEARKRIESQSMWTLRQSTSSQEIPLGQFVDETDGVTPLTALTIANTEIKLFPTGATSFTNKNSGGATHISNGHYYTVLDATDTATIGPMKIVVDKSGALPVVLYCKVLNAAVYDVEFGTTAPSTLGANPTVDVTKWNGTAVSTPATAGVPNVNVVEWRGTTPSTMAAGAIRADLDSVKTQSVTCANPVTILASVGTASTSTAQTGDGYAVVSSGTHGNAALKTLSDGIKTKTDQMTFTVTNRIDATATLSAAESDVISSGTATAGAATTITLQTALGANDLPNGAIIKITSGTGAGQTRRVKDYVNGTKVLTVNRAWTVTPDNTSVYAVTYADQTPETHVVVGNCFTSTAGEEVRIAAWLERDGEMLALASGSASVTYREHGSGVDVFTETASAPTGQGVFEFTKTTASPGTPIFTSDRLQVASVSITDPEGNVYTSKTPSPIFG